jgi:hypothetical protein
MAMARRLHWPVAMSRRLACLLLVPALLLAACISEDEPTEPIAGSWWVQRTARGTTPGCPQLDPDDFELVLTLDGDGEPPVVTKGVSLYEWSPNRLDETSVTFTTNEYAFSDNFDPVLVLHDLALVDGQLVGTASARGDGPRLGCSWTFDVVATQPPDCDCAFAAR